MKFLKWFSLFFVSVGLALIIGVVIGFRLEKFFYPQSAYPEIVSEEQEKAPRSFIEDMPENPELQVVATSAREEKINADTVYICVERDMYTGEEVTVCSRIPQLYMGMTREQFVESMEEYERNPPLSERERGFEDLEILRFSTAEVEVLMNYKYVQPSESFYIIVFDDKVKVLLDDRKTTYLDTGIRAYDLPFSIQQEIIQGMYIPNEEALYDFLENYTS